MVRPGSRVQKGVCAIACVGAILNLRRGIRNGGPGDGGESVPGRIRHVVDKAGQWFGEYPQMIGDDAFVAGYSLVDRDVELDRVPGAVGHDHGRGTATVQVDAVVRAEAN